MSVLPALQAANGPVGGTLGVGVGLEVGDVVAFEGGDAVAVGLVVSDGLGVGEATAGLANRASANEAAAVRPTEILR